jgi:hypothetical protein
MMCSASDLGTECHETRGNPERILLYDKHPGGIGIASKVIAEIEYTRSYNPGYVEYSWFKPHHLFVCSIL